MPTRDDHDPTRPVDREEELGRYQRALLDLAEREQQLRLALSGGDLGLWDWDVPTGRLSVNERWKTMLGLAPDFDGATLDLWHARVHPEDLHVLDRLVREVILPPSGRGFEAEIRARREDGAWVWILDKGAVVARDADGRPLRVVGTHMDVTARRRAEEQLRDAQRMESVGRLAGGVAHDFNNMLGVILGNAEVALDRAPVGPVRDCLLEIQRAARRSADLTGQLLTFARRQPVAPRVLDLNTTVRGLISMLRRLIGETVALEFHPHAELWPIRMDPSQVEHLLTNLCVNARDAIDGFGVITIETAPHTVGQEGSCAGGPVDPGDYVRLTVRDTGRGIDAATLPHVFEPFFTTKGPGKGTGLGLATVYGTVTQSGGFVEVESEPGRGTAFHVHFRRYDGPAPASDARPEPEPRPADPARRTVLVVEDEPGLLRLARRVLEAEGHAVITAATPVLALREAQGFRGRIHLLVADLVLPQMSGQTLAERVEELHPGLARVFMSGHAAQAATAELLAVGSAFLPKPFSVAELVEVVRLALEACGG